MTNPVNYGNMANLGRLNSSGSGGSNPYQQYKQTQVQTASQGSLILMLYDGALKFLQQTKISLTNNDVTAAHKSLLKTQDIITELMITLNLDAGEVARNLLNLYDYMYRRLVEANIKKDIETIDEIIGLLQELRTAWGQIIKPARQQMPIGGGIDYGK